MQAAILAFILAVIACPLSLLIYLFINILFNRFIHVSKLKASHLNTYFSLALIAIGIILHQHISTLDLLRYLGARLSIIGATFTDGSYSLSDYLLSNPFTIGICLLILTLAGKLTFFTTERQLLWSEERFQKRKMSKLFNNNPDFVPTRSTLIFGVSGAGKSAYIARMVQDIIAKEDEPFIVLVDGKGSTEEYSLYYSARIIAKKHGLTLRIINGTANDSLGGTVYDFLDGITVPNQAKDMIMSLIEDDTIQESSGSEHYRIMTEAYMEKIITFMMRNEIKVTLSNVVNMMKPDYFNDVCNQMKIPAEDTITIKNYMKQNWKDVQASVTKLELFLGDQGRKIFTNPDGKETTNLRKAYQNREMVLVLADEMSMPQLAQGLVKILAMDLRNLTAMRLTEKMDMDRMVYATFDEFTSYTSALPILKSLFARARSADCVMTLATQSISDITGLQGNWYESLVNTADRFIIFRQHGKESPEAAASIIGTELHVTTTSRSSGSDMTGEHSNTLDREYIIHPDTIRDLSANTGICLDKKQNQLYLFKNKFI